MGRSPHEANRPRSVASATYRVYAPLFITLVLTLAAGVLLPSLPGCDSPTPAPSGDYLPTTTPENVLENYRRSMEQRDIDAYARWLHPEFVLGAPDGDGVGLAVELAMTRELFENVESLVLDFEHRASEPSSYPAYPAADGFRQIHVESSRLILDTAANTPGESRSYDVSDRNWSVVFAPDGHAPTRWSIIYWGQPRRHVHRLTCRRSATRCAAGRAAPAPATSRPRRATAPRRPGARR